MSLDRRLKAVCIAMTVTFLTGTHNRSHAEESILMTIGPRIGFSTTSTPLLGKQQKEDFRLYDVAALLRLPWHSQLGNSSWKLGTRLITSLGVIEGGGDAGLLATFVPDVALSGWNGLISLDGGLGIGLFSRSKFGVQTLGGSRKSSGQWGSRSLRLHMDMRGSACSTSPMPAYMGLTLSVWTCTCWRSAISFES